MITINSVCSYYKFKKPQMDSGYYIEATRLDRYLGFHCFNKLVSNASSTSTYTVIVQQQCIFDELDDSFTVSIIFRFVK